MPAESNGPSKDKSGGSDIIKHLRVLFWRTPKGHQPSPRASAKNKKMLMSLKSASCQPVYKL